MQWFAVMSVVKHSEIKRRKAIYEERIVMVRARSAAQATDRARKADARYLALNPRFEQISYRRVFALNAGITDLDSNEVRSSLHQGSADPAEFIRQKYENFMLDEECCSRISAPAASS